MLSEGSHRPESKMASFWFLPRAPIDCPGRQSDLRRFDLQGFGGAI